jgi:hypothetical protein
VSVYVCVYDVSGFVCLSSGLYKDKSKCGIIRILDGVGKVEDW